MTHICHAHQCSVPVPPAMFMCKKHWYALRKPLRDAVWATYRPGQEVDKRPSMAYLAVQQWAIGELAFRPHDEEAARDAAPYLLTAQALRERVIAEGGPDPLEGLVKKIPVDGEL